MISYGNDPDGRQTLPQGAPRNGRRTVWLAGKPSRTDDALFILGLTLFAAGLGFMLLQALAPATAAKASTPPELLPSAVAT